MNTVKNVGRVLDLSRKVGTISRGVRCPIIREGDNLVEIVVESILEASASEGYEMRDRDIVAITESVVARAQGNYATIDHIATDVKAKLNSDTIGVIFPILSRNRFSTVLKGVAKGAKKIVLMLSYPSDEVGNELITLDALDASGVNPYSDVLDLETFRNHFGYPIHPFTGMDYIAFYEETIREQGCDVEIIFANNPKAILDYTNHVLTCDIHSAKRTKRILNDNGVACVIGLEDLLTQSVNGSGFNESYGLLGSNKATEDSVKLFPRDSFDLVDEIQAHFKTRTGKIVEVMVYGDGAFKDPMGKIWELADPTVAPAFTKGLDGTPNELKLKYLADNDFKDLNGEALTNAISNEIKNKNSDLVGNMASQGTTPRRIVDLVGSLCDLTSGSGDKGTPIVHIQGYFDNLVSE